MKKKTPAKASKKRAAKENWIAGAIGKPGVLHRALGVPKGTKIPLAKLKAHDTGNSPLAKRARLAETLRKFKH